MTKEQNIQRLSTETAAQRANRHAVYATAYAYLSGAVHTTAWELESQFDYDDAEQAIR